MKEFKKIVDENYIYNGYVEEEILGPYGFFKYPDSLYFGEVSNKKKAFGIKEKNQELTFGAFKKNKADGIVLSSIGDGQIVFGFRKNDKLNGINILLDGNNGFYCGNFLNDTLDGNGVLYDFRTGSFSFRTYQKDSLVATSVEFNNKILFTGFESDKDFVLDKINDSPFIEHIATYKEKWIKHIQNETPALGILEEDNKTYFGMWKNIGTENGIGMLKKNNNYYFGNINKGALFGYGMKIEKDTYLLGTFINNIISGFSICLNKASKIIIGPVEKQKLNGMAMIIDASSNFIVSIVNYRDGVISDTLSTTAFSASPLEEKAEEMSLEEAEDTLQGLIGLETVKKRIEYLKAFVLKNKQNKIHLNMAFLGNPGTGKTLVARLLGKILYKNGITKNQNFVEVSCSELVSQYVKETPVKTKEVISRAMGGVLFIDEAYSLVGTSENDHGIEAVNTLIKEMEDHAGEFVCIMAGYTKEMMNFFSTNPGFKSRIQYFIDFPDYTELELKEILNQMVKKLDYTIDILATNKIIEIAEVKRNEPNFANAREIRNILEKVLLYQAIRTKDLIDDRHITVDDVLEYISDESIILKTDTSLAIYEKQLDELIGLKDVKRKIKLYASYMKKNKGSNISLHMAFMGNPGTGKTLVARLLGKILYKEKILPTDKFIEVTRESLVARFVGQTASKTKEVISRAMGGVLFIDEAYSLVSDGKGDFGEEAIATLIKELEDHQGEFACIIAGYNDEIIKLLESNPGFKSRIQYFVSFPDYTDLELKEILDLMVKNTGYTIDDDAREKLIEIVNTKRSSKNFANARDVRSTLEKVKMHQAERTINEMENKNITIDDVNALILEEKIVLKSTNSSYEMPDLKTILYENFMYKPSPFVDIRLDVEEAVIAIYNNSSTKSSEGSGFIISKDGYAVTCAHCIRGATNLRVRRRIKDRHNADVDIFYEAAVCVSDDTLDLAIIKLLDTSNNFSFLPLLPEQSKKVSALDEVILLGYPFGVSRFDALSVNLGRVASYQTGSPDYINLDISAKSGNSGSCVIDKNTCYVIGVLCGSNLSKNNDLVEEVNYCRPASYIWAMLKDENNKKLTKNEKEINI